MLRRISLHTAVIAALACFALFVGTISILAAISDRHANAALERTHFYDRLRTDNSMAGVIWLDARVRLEIAADYIEQGRTVEADRQLEIVANAAEQVKTLLDGLMAAPLEAERGESLRQEMAADYAATQSLMPRMREALEQRDIPTFRVLRNELTGVTDALAVSATDFSEYLNSLSEIMIDQYDAEGDLYAWIDLGMILLAALVLALFYVGLRRVVIQPVAQAVAVVNRMAEGELSHKIVTTSENEIGKLLNALCQMRLRLVDMIGTVREGSGAILVGSQEIASGNADLSSRTDQQAAALEETAASMEQLTATVEQNADNALQASGLAQEATSTAEHGGEVVQQVITTMRDISEGSRKVADITGLIDSIAFQTNILALNASVEAARAGEQGRGFAVVAGEVRNLAGRSATAANEIKELIEHSVGQVSRGSALVEDAGKTMREVVMAVKRVTDIMDEISSASQEQSAGIDQVNQAVGQMDGVTQRNAALVKQAAAAAASLEGQAQHLEQVVAVFRLNEHEVQARRGLSSQPAMTPDRPSSKEEEPSPASRAAALPSASGTTTKTSTEEEWLEF
ncbi:methyl-accepting chemotaxis protein [Litchfieldella qijiaojingensis]|uniref:Methyl-accepting chemotaxis protein n=1 Tax=Litchfieldella qijiaojingensis TaxID=980347 RepID=A0ABQ2YHU3_9GAMM|nr:methyl-accepting chemotaxis protein [Halomonas qijiaojingensis]GGX84206.1 methyl-accepting chemotaxis protein [Halomonas qijiaojingensis]